jgi:hypothetical protein
MHKCISHFCLNFDTIHGVRFNCPWGSGGIVPLILTSALLRRYVISFMPQPLHPIGKQFPVQLKRSLHGPHSQSGHLFRHCLEWKSDSLVVQPTAYSLCWLIFVCLFRTFCVTYTWQQQQCKSSVFTSYLSVYYKLKFQSLWNQTLCLLYKTQDLCESQTQRDIDSKGFWWWYITHRITWFLDSYPVSVVHNRKLYFELSCFCLQLKRLWGI